MSPRKERSSSPDTSWRNTSRILRGRKKGKFAKKSVVMQMEKAQTTLLNKRLCEAKSAIKNKNEWFNKCNDILDGRRIVELVMLASELWCENCDLPLSLRHATDEFRSGLASVITVKCTNCGSNRFVNTNKAISSNDVNLDSRTYSVNLKAAMGMIDAGMGETHLNTLLSALNVPAVSAPMVKRHERSIGKAIESVAEESCKEALELEKN